MTEVHPFLLSLVAQGALYNHHMQVFMIWRLFWHKTLSDHAHAASMFLLGHVFDRIQRPTSHVTPLRAPFQRLKPGGEEHFYAELG